MLVTHCHRNLHVTLGRLRTFFKLRLVQNEIDVIAHVSWQYDLGEAQTRHWSHVVEFGRVVLDLGVGGGGRGGMVIDGMMGNVERAEGHEE